MTSVSVVIDPVEACSGHLLDTSRRFTHIAPSYSALSRFSRRSLTLLIYMGFTELAICREKFLDIRVLQADQLRRSNVPEDS
jgi:hypothetical protein